MTHVNEESFYRRSIKAASEITRAIVLLPDERVQEIIAVIIQRHIREAIREAIADEISKSQEEMRQVFFNINGESPCIYAPHIGDRSPVEESVFISGAKEESIIEETKMKVIPIVINKETYEITISIKNNALLINDALISGLNDVAEIHWSGPALNISSDKSLYVSGDISGNAEASNHINCGNVGQNAIAGTSIHCGAVGGDVHASGPVNIKK